MNESKRRWEYILFREHEDKVDPTIGDRGMIDIDAMILVEVLGRMIDKETDLAYEKYVSIDENGARCDACFHNSMKAVNY